MKNLLKSLIISLSLLMTSSVIAEDTNATGFYGGIGVSAMKFVYFGSTASTMTDRTVYLSSINPIVLIGYKFNEYISVETEASHLLKRSTVKSIGNVAWNSNRWGVDHRSHFVRFEPPKSGALTPYGRLGFFTWKAERECLMGDPLCVLNQIDSATDTNIAYGLGINYEWDDNSSIRIDYTTLESSSTINYSVISVMRVFSF